MPGEQWRKGKGSYLATRKGVSTWKPAIPYDGLFSAHYLNEASMVSDIYIYIIYIPPNILMNTKFFCCCCRFYKRRFHTPSAGEP